MNNLYKELFNLPKLMSKDQAYFETVAQRMYETSSPKDFDVPEPWLNDNNKQLWQKAIRELKKIDK